MLATQIVYNAGNKWMAKDLGLDIYESSRAEF
jgi:hypothetical protein